jgi:mxaK protein
MALTSWFNVKNITWCLIIVVLASLLGSLASYRRIQQIESFNRAASTGETPQTDQQSFEAKFNTALYLAKKERFKEATLLYTQLLPLAKTPQQKSAVQYDLGNIFFLRGLAINGTSMTVKNEAEYLVRQAKIAYIASIKADNHYWDARHNLDRVLGMLPSTPTPGVGESDSPGLIMGNIPVGLP